MTLLAGPELDSTLPVSFTSMCDEDTPHFSNPGANVSNLVLNSDGSVKNLAGFAQVTSVTNNGRDGIDQRQFLLMLRVSF